MESYEDLRLEKRDKVAKPSFFKRLFKKDGYISEQNLDFLEERYHNQQGDDKQSKQEQNEFEKPILDSNFLDSRQDLQTEQTDILLLDDLLLANKDLKDRDLHAPKSGVNVESHLEISEREAVLDDLDLNTKEIPFKLVLITLCLMALALVLFIPKIYVRNNIYYASRNIIQLQAQIDSLREENKHIKKQLEDIKFRNLTQELDF